MKNLFEWMRNKKTQPLTTPKNINTVPLDDAQMTDALSSVQRIAPQQIMVACAQSVGIQRDHNEDHVLAFNVTIGGEGNNYPFGVFVVADGMGGHQYGEIASSTAIRTFSAYLIKHFLPFLTNPSSGLDEPLQDLVRSAIQEAQVAVTKVAPGSGTTLTAAIILGQQVTIGHVGDSRAYAIKPDGRMDPVTRDHSLVKRLEELGQISSDEAGVHPQRSVLYRAVGQGEILEPDIFTIPFPQPGHLMICSDGLWSVIPGEAILKIVNETPDIYTACQELTDAANAAGGPDNISVILVKLLG